MTRSVIFFLMCLISLIPPICTTDPADSEELIRSRRIVSGGDPATQDEHPYVVSIRYPNKKVLCTGALIDGNRLDKTVIILTAAHCFCNATNTLRRSYKDLLVVYGGVQGSETYTSDAITNAIDAVVCHPSYQWSPINNDIAIVKLKKPFYYSDPGPKSIERLKDNKTNLVNLTCVTAGYGYKDSNRSAVDSLQELEVKIMSQADCEKALPANATKDNKICYINATGSGHSGDSGAPIVCPINGKPMIVSVHSSTKSGQSNKTRTYRIRGVKSMGHRLSIYSDWIEQTIKTLDPISQAEVNCEAVPGTKSMVSLTCKRVAAGVRKFDPLFCDWVGNTINIVLRTAKFNGNQYAEMATGPWDPRTETKIRLSFKTLKPEGLIFYVEDKDFFAIQITDGYLRLMYNLGGGVAQMYSTSTLNDGYWHEVIILRNEQAAIMLVDEEIDAVHNVSSPGTYKDLDVGKSYFIGGVNGKLHRWRVNSTGFNGCIKNVKVGKLNVNFKSYISASRPLFESSCKPGPPRRRQFDQPIKKQRPGTQAGRTPKLPRGQPKAMRQSPKELAQKGISSSNRKKMEEYKVF